MPGLALGITQLTITHPELLLAVPMKGLRTRPAIPVDLQDSRHLPGDPIGHQDFDRFGVVAIPPQDHDPHLVFDIGNPHRRREIPLPSVSLPQFLAILRRIEAAKSLALTIRPFHSRLRLVFRSPT